ncbi:MAG: hypothetical protein PWQ67_972 [Clostridia bacterium]|jgi:hypothetical protein|nr:hypothetical protein [Clostridia bacterium]MDN5322518.1 hypothetical protein [Clostridia bacterium]
MGNIDPYKAGMFKKNPYAKKQDIKGKLVVVLDGKMENRGLQLITPISRCIQKYEIHELIFTDEIESGPGKKVDRIAYLGFFEVEQGSVMVTGDEVYLNDKLIGYIAGFDETHMPNHLNIVIKSQQLLTGLELDAQVGAKICFKKPENN